MGEKGNFAALYQQILQAEDATSLAMCLADAKNALLDDYQNWRLHSATRIKSATPLNASPDSWRELFDYLDLPDSPLLIPFHWPENTKVLIASWQQLLKVFPSAAEASFALQGLSDAGDELQSARQDWSDQIADVLVHGLTALAANDLGELQQLTDIQLAQYWIDAANAHLEAKSTDSAFITSKQRAEIAEQLFPAGWKQIQKYLVRFAGIASSADLEQVLQQQQQILEQNQRQHQQQMDKMQQIENKLDLLLQQNKSAELTD